MRAVVATGRGGPEVLELRELARPEPAEGEVLVRLRAASVNPVDTKRRAGGTARLGCDGAGIVAGIGPHVAKLKEGDEVYFCHGGVGGPYGCYAEFTCVPAEAVALKPRSQDFHHAAAGPLVLITAWEAIHERLRLRSGATLLILGASGGVGHVAVQLARIVGARVAGTVGSTEKAEFAKRLGAEHAVHYRTEDLQESVRTWSADGVEAIVDTVSGEMLAKAIETLRPYGAVASILPPSVPLPWGAMFTRNVALSLIFMLVPQIERLPNEIARQREILVRCAELFDRGELTVRVAEVLPLERAADAHSMVETNATMGKVVLDIP